MRNLLTYSKLRTIDHITLKPRSYEKDTYSARL